VTAWSAPAIEPESGWRSIGWTRFRLVLVDVVLASGP
jgi:hypothetical protein